MRAPLRRQSHRKSVRRGRTRLARGDRVDRVGGGLLLSPTRTGRTGRGRSGADPQARVSYPVDPQIVESFIRQVRSVFVIEERRGFMEEQIAEIVGKLNQTSIAAGRTNVWGKEFPAGLKGIPSIRGLNPSILIERLAPLGKFFHDPNLRLDMRRIDAAVQLIRQTETFDVRVPPRTPTFCPGCPHRDSASVLVEMKKQFLDAITCGDSTGAGRWTSFPRRHRLLHDADVRADQRT